MKNKFFKKALSVFTAMAMALSLMTGIPFSELGLGITVSAETTTYDVNAKTIAGLGTSVIVDPTAPANDTDAWNGSYVYYGNYNGSPVKYRVLDASTTKFGGTTMFLDCDSILYYTPFDNDRTANEDGKKANDWSISDVKNSLNGDGFLNKAGVFTTAEKNAIAASTVEAHALTTNSATGVNVESGTQKNFVNYVALTGEQIFLLDAEDVSNGAYGYSMTNINCENRKKTGSSYAYWWLRSAYDITVDNAGYVTGKGILGTIRVNYDRPGVSPALNLNLSSVLFSSVISGTAGETGAEYKLTLLDGDMTIATSGDVTRNGKTVTVPYSISGANSANATQVSVLVLDKEYTAGNTNGATVLDYQKLNVDSFSTSGTGTFALPSGLTGTLGTDYHIYLLAEHVNADNSTDYASDPVKVEEIYLDISELDISDATVVQSNTLTYDNTAQTPTFTVTLGNTTLTADDYDVTVTAQTNAGSYTATITGKGNYRGTISNVTWSIGKATPSVTAPTAKTGLVYNGTAQELIDKGSTDFGTLVYSLNENGEYSTAIPKGTNAGTYTVYYKVQGDSNVEDVAAEQITATIGKAEATVKAKNYTVKFGNPLPESLEYETDGLIGTDTLSSIGANVTIGYVNAVTPSAIGNYTIVVSGEATTTNYELTYENGKLTIIEKPAQIITAADIKLSYGDTGKKIGAATSGDGAITYAVASGDDVIRVATDGTITALKAGTATVEITAAETFDYAKATKTVTVTVNKKKVAVPTADATEYTYNGKAQTYGVVSTDDYTVTGGTQTDAGNYPITITLNNENFEWDGVLGTYTFIIKKAAVTITANSYTVKVGNTLPKFDYKVSGLVNNEALPITVTVSCTAADSKTAGEYPITVSGAADSTNYTFNYVDGTLTITLKDIQTITAADVTLTYGDAGKKIGATTNGDGAITYAVASGDDVIRVAADGTITALKAGTATVEITAAETDDYAEATKTVTVTVNKAAVTIKADDKTVYQNAALPTFTYSVTGLANGDKLSFTPVLTCEATTTSTVGTYAITVTIEITEDECYTYTTTNGTLTVKKKSSGGGGGGGYRPTTPTEPNNPSIGGSAKSWSDVAADLGKLTNGSEATIELNGNTTVPIEVIKAIADKDSKVTFVINSVFSWVVDGAEITTPVAIDLTLIKTASTKSDTLRGIEGTQFKINGTNIPTDLMIAFKKEHEGKFANLYKVVDGKLVFVTCAKLGEDGKVILPDVVEKGDYVAMLCEFSDRLGDMDNDGVMNAKDALAILKDIVEIEPGKNPLMADFNGDGHMNVMDAAAILKRIVGLA